MSPGPTGQSVPDAPTGQRLLRIYLNDHLMGSAGGIELAQRCQRSNRGTPLGDFLSDLIDEIRDDRAVLEQLMTDLAVPTDRVKLLAATVAERVARFKLNGSLLTYSDLSRLVELEALCAGVYVKQRMWLSLQRVRAADPLLIRVDVDRMVERAAAQLAALERHREDAAARAFAGDAAAGRTNTRMVRPDDGPDAPGAPGAPDDPAGPPGRP